MTFQIDRRLPWTEHYVEHGFAVVEGLVGRDYCRRALEAIARELGTDLPPQQWTTQTIRRQHTQGRTSVSSPVAKEVFDEPGLRRAIDALFGRPDRFDPAQSVADFFLCLWDPANAPHLKPVGHIDFVNVPIPVIGSGFACQVSLVDSEHFSGNITIYPGTHKRVQEYVLEHPDYRFDEKGEAMEVWKRTVGDVEPFEFVARQGDVLFFHHLVGHEGNANAARGRSPRVVVHARPTSREWPNRLEPAEALSPWERSLAHNGPIRLGYDERELVTSAFRAKKQTPEAQPAP